MTTCDVSWWDGILALGILMVLVCLILAAFLLFILWIINKMEVL